MLACMWISAHCKQHGQLYLSLESAGKFYYVEQRFTFALFELTQNIRKKKKGKHESKLSVKRFEDIQSNNFFEGSYCFFLHHFTLIFHCSSPSLSLFVY